MTISKIVKQVASFVTFTDIPIWKKILLFAGGGVAWFIVIAVIGLGAISYVNESSRTLTDHIVPQIKASQKLIIQMRGANVSVHNIVIHDDVKFVKSNVSRATYLLDDVRGTLNALLTGGTIRDFSDLTGELIEEIHVKPMADNSIAEKFIGDVLGNSHTLRESLQELSELKLKGLSRGGLDQEEQALFMQKLREYDTLTVQSVMILGKLTSSISALQKEYTGNIKTVLRQAMTIIIIIGMLAISLVILFSYLLKMSITKPLSAITDQIKGLSEGEVDLSKQIEIGTKDEIAELSINFNILMNMIHDMNTFKKVIEEDDTLDDVYIRMAEVFHEHLGLDDLVIFEVSDRNSITLIETPYSRNMICCNKGILADSSLCRARKTGHTISSIRYDKICKHFLLSPEKYHVCLPIMVGGSTGAIVQFQFDKALRKDHETPTPIMDVDCIKKLVLKAEQYIRESSAVVETKRLNSALKESSIRDQMTGLYNRRFLEEYVETLVAGVLRKGGQIGLLMCDLDFFKEVNDKYGHDVGDALLKETANVIVQSARTSDMVIRFGGEEFLVIVNDAHPGESETIAQRIRKQITEAKVKTGEGYIQKTISIGYCEFPKDTQHFWEAIKYADIALYKAKEAGRNKVMHFEKEMWTAKAY